MKGMDTSTLRRTIMDAVDKATPWATTAEVPSDDIANEVLATLGLDDIEKAVERMAVKLYAARGDYPHIDTQGLDMQDCGILAGEMLFALLATGESEVS